MSSLCSYCWSSWRCSCTCTSKKRSCDCASGDGSGRFRALQNTAAFTMSLLPACTTVAYPLLNDSLLILSQAALIQLLEDVVSPAGTVAAISVCWTVSWSVSECWTGWQRPYSLSPLNRTVCRRKKLCQAPRLFRLLLVHHDGVRIHQQFPRAAALESAMLHSCCCCSWT